MRESKMESLSKYNQEHIFSLTRLRREERDGIRLFFGQLLELLQLLSQ
jgi:hypothetical protein